MSHTFSCNHVRVVFSTKERRKTIPKEIQSDVWAYVGGISRNHEMTTLAVGGTENHIHILLRLPPTMALSKGVQLLKANSSKWLSERGEKFAWQEGYGAFSVSSSNLDRVVRYIQNQEAHHRKGSFEEEFRALLVRHGLEYDPSYVFG